MGTSRTVEDQRLALAMDAAQLGSWTWDIASGVTTWDERLEEMHGMPAGGFGGGYEDWVASLHPDDRATCIARVEQALADPGPYVLRHRTIWPDGSLHSIECRGTVLVDDDGRPIGTTGVAIEVTIRDQLVQVLQRALLPVSLPAVPGATVVARYRAAERRNNIGGDWYAVVPLESGRLGLAIGDVAGHGLDAVSDMATARYSLRALALHEQRPEDVLHELNRVVRTFEPGALITAIYGVLDPLARTWTYASAGHVPAALRLPGRSAVLLDEQADAPLGVDGQFRAVQVELEKGATLLLYTDGLIERRTEPLTDGLDRLVAACIEAPADPGAFCDHVLDRLVRDNPGDDDIALLAVTLD
jgi:Stage II sporulation protein E (SpoIIE)/PAS fold